jgi:hypothetical protein
MGAGVLMLFTFFIDAFSAADSYEWQQHPQFKPWRIGTSSLEQLTEPGTHALACLGTSSLAKHPQGKRRRLGKQKISGGGGGSWPDHHR